MKIPISFLLITAATLSGYAVTEPLRIFGTQIKTVTLNDSTADDFCLLGENYMKVKDFNAALIAFNKAIAISPSAKHYSKRGVCFMFQGKVSEARVDFDLAISLDPKYAEAYLFKGSIYQFGDDDKTAIKLYTKAIEVNPNYAEAYMMRALLIRKKNKKDACKDLKKAVELGLEKAEAIYNETCN